MVYFSFANAKICFSIILIIFYKNVFFNCRTVLSTCRKAVFGIQNQTTCIMKQGTINTTHCRNLQSLSTSSMFGNLLGEANSCTRHNSLLSVPCSANLQQVRYLKQPVNPNKKIRYQYYRYRFSAWKRIHKFGLEARLSSVSQKKILWRRLIKGRPYLTVCDRILDHSNRTVPNREKPQLRKLGKKTNFPIYSYKPPLFKFRGD